MKITINPPAGPFVLGDDDLSLSVFTGSSLAAFANGLGGGVVEGFRPKTRASVQKTPLFRSAYQFLAARDNLLTSYSFTVERFFATAQICGLFVDCHADQIPVTGYWMTQHDTETGILKLYRPTAYFENAECVEFEQEHCTFRYEFTLGGPVQTTVPS
jgi:hypothetical protein